MHTHTHTQLLFEAAGVEDTKTILDESDKQNVPAAVNLLRKVDEVRRCVCMCVCECMDVYNMYLIHSHSPSQPIFIYIHRSASSSHRRPLPPCLQTPMSP